MERFKMQCASALLFLLLCLLRTARAAEHDYIDVSIQEVVHRGEPTVIKYISSNMSYPATIVLRKGTIDNFVIIQNITASATGGKFTWTPSSDLELASDYHLLIQEYILFSYSPPFTVVETTRSNSSPLSGVIASASALPASGEQLSVGAKAGIGLGSAMLACMIGVGAFILGRRKTKTLIVYRDPETPKQELEHPKAELEDSKDPRVAELMTQANMVELPSPENEARFSSQSATTAGVSPLSER